MEAKRRARLCAIRMAPRATKLSPGLEASLRGGESCMVSRPVYESPTLL
jgi:hypothetical protein